ncbi:hypothetical protein D3C86_1649370 [compost metagenome]
MYTCHKVLSNGQFTNCERLSKAEYQDFVSSVYGKWENIRVLNEITGEIRFFVDNGQAWERVV